MSNLQVLISLQSGVATCIIIGVVGRSHFQTRMWDHVFVLFESEERKIIITTTTKNKAGVRKRQMGPLWDRRSVHTARSGETRRSNMFG